jgi:acyl dehydratase
VATNIYFEDLEVGYELAPWSRTTDLMHWNRYAAVNDEFIYIHMDDDAGRAALNANGAFGMGNLRYAYLLNSIRDAFGDDVEVREVGCQHRALNQKGDVLTVTATVVELMPNGEPNAVRLALNVMNQYGVGTCPGHAVVIVPNRVAA